MGNLVSVHAVGDSGALTLLQEVPADGRPYKSIQYPESTPTSSTMRYPHSTQYSHSTRTVLLQVGTLPPSFGGFSKAAEIMLTSAGSALFVRAPRLALSPLEYH